MKKKILASLLGALLVAISTFTAFNLLEVNVVNVYADDDNSQETETSEENGSSGGDSGTTQETETSEENGSSESNTSNTTTDTTSSGSSSSTSSSTDTTSTSTTSVITTTPTKEETNESQAEVTIDSSSAIKAENVKAEGYTVTDLNTATISDITTEITNVLNDLSTVATLLEDDDLKAAASDTSASVVATVLSYVDISADTAEASSDGSYKVSVSFDGVTASDTILVIHYNTTSGEFETIKPSEIKDGVVTFNVSSFSPFAFVKVAVEEVTTTSTTTENASTTTTDTTSSTSSTTTSTGDNASPVIYAVLIMAALALAGYESKKYLKEIK